ncbi:MAG: hypothetical protein KAY24_16235 [Candidatus Eisenbacteria sp.]|nr:hypothetical protein [Candidatus Eisenbacteria bacterium]
MKTVTEQEPVSMELLHELAAARFGDMVKAVVDVARGIMVIDAELHSDEEAELLASGSRQKDLWGINLYPDLPLQDWLEYDSMINLRPSFGNRSRGVDDNSVRDLIRAVVDRLVSR